VSVGDFNSDGRLDVACIADDPGEHHAIGGAVSGQRRRNVRAFRFLSGGFTDAALADVNTSRRRSRFRNSRLEMCCSSFFNPFEESSPKPEKPIAVIKT
jgi:hypothetical protein